MNKPQEPEALPLKICSASMGRDEIALAFFTALLPRALDEADRMAFPEGALKLMKLEISAAWEMADLWISEREEKYPTWK
jgi:hypothetical protein